MYIALSFFPFFPFLSFLFIFPQNQSVNYFREASSELYQKEVTRFARVNHRRRLHRYKHTARPVHIGEGETGKSQRRGSEHTRLHKGRKLKKGE